jgi:hypothetical protein
MAILTQKEKKIVFVCREREQELKKKQRGGVEGGN